ncbi:MAG: hypothetical protein ABS75_15710 [Pelagibacterium sp. SCN 63-23]|nr:MAG: hypothetical protein ABS75_15710 [Pelagibacterium sp. SCN 63-23]
MLLATIATPAAEASKLASNFCVEMNGRIERFALANGDDIDLCLLCDSRIVEEWAFYLEHNRKGAH